MTNTGYVHTRYDRADDTETGGVRRGVGRRAFVGLVGAGAAAAVLAGMFSRFAQETVGKVLPTGRFRVYTVTSGYPDMALQDWRLSVRGKVARPLELDMAGLEAIGLVEAVQDFHCVTGWTVRDVAWRGVPLAAVLDAAGAPESGAAVEFRSFDGAYHEALSMEQARLPDNLVATHLAGAPLPRAQGFPARVIVPSMYGYKGTKWISDIAVVDDLRPGYWELRGYDRDAWVGRSNGYGA